MRVIDKDAVRSVGQKSDDNLILIDKPERWSSFHATGIKKVGHGGTLDPFATGLLIIGTGKETKSLSNISNATKDYIANIELGKSTDTYDVTGKITKEKFIDDISGLNIEQILESFLGEIMQIPPMFSAKKIRGKRLYKMARKGIEVERKAQRINIFELKLVASVNNQIEVYIKCSKGTYIRTLAHDIGNKCGYGAYLKSLRRVAINDYVIEKALILQDFIQYWKSLN
jgi:tRNA pseudouridine55 synthase